jgi:hypothetical protein
MKLARLLTSSSREPRQLLPRYQTGSWPVLFSPTKFLTGTNKSPVAPVSLADHQPAERRQWTHDAIF